ncbi:type II secretion system F family protein [Erythrobacter sp. 3-20A1M]|uniref:type II secretion system F family protein n=1 Tax=Erythrobacter sp. 3-20A1M TaxID=2653850 RepID=UPI00203D3437|nr:type II secretion system F family protein [Erythrobacter sp. 3-20A1M]
MILLSSATGPTLLGVDVIFAGTVLAAIAALSVLFAVYTAMSVKNPMAKRLRALNARRDELKSGIVKSTARKRQSLVKRTNQTELVRERLEKMKVLQQSQLKDIRQKLAHAGYRNPELAFFVIGARMVVPITLGLLVFFVVYLGNSFPEWGDFKRFATFAAAVGIGYKAPEIFLKNKATKRTAEIRKGLPDALDLLVICAEAGLTVDAAFGRVARELGSAYPELGEEFTLTSIELSFLSERKQAFDNLAYRVNLESVRGVVTTMIQTERYGTPLASALRVLSAEFRNERMMRAEEKAARLPAIMTIPLILFILPVLFIVILGPAACSIADAFAAGGPVKG